jgi:hypothetical protein
VWDGIIQHIKDWVDKPANKTLAKDVLSTAQARQKRHVRSKHIAAWLVDPINASETGNVSAKGAGAHTLTYTHALA